jgi:AcrR family transcriptional regulator
VPLTEAGIYATALRLIDAEGVEALSMRKLAAELDANPMSLYHHVPNKEALLRGVAALVGAEFRSPPADGLPWQNQLRRLATDFRALAHRHPNLMAYSFRQPDFIQSDDPFWFALTGILDAAELPETEIRRARAVLCGAVTGVLLAELNGALQRWSALDPIPTASGKEATEVDHLWDLTLDVVVTVVEQQFTATSTDRGDPG